MPENIVVSLTPKEFIDFNRWKAINEYCHIWIGNDKPLTNLERYKLIKDWAMTKDGSHLYMALHMINLLIDDVMEELHTDIPD